MGRHWRRDKPHFRSAKDRDFVLLPADSVLTNITVDDQKRKESWSVRLGAWSQIGMLFVLTIGYFFTVRPIFQHQLLQEQSAKLRIEKSDTEKELQFLVNKQTQIENHLVILKRNLEHEHDESQKLVVQMRKSRVREKKLEKKLKAQLTTLEAARREQLFLDFSSSYSVSMFNKSLSKIFSNEQETTEEHILSQSKRWPKPYEDLIAAIEKIKTKNMKNHDYPNEYIKTIRDIIEAKKSTLRCELPNFSAMAERYLKDINVLDGEIDRELDDYIEDTINKYKQKGEKISIADDFREVSRNSIRLGKVFTVDRRYKKEINTLRDSCEDIASDAIQDIKAAIIVSR